MEKIFKAFLEENSIYKPLDGEYDYTFGNKNSKENFILEFRKFVRMCNTVFYEKDRLVTVFNSCEIRLKKEIIDHLFNLYIYAKEKDMPNEKIVLIEFLYTYYKTITSTAYKENYPKFKEAKEEFKNVVKEKFLNEEFYIKSIEDIYSFYNKLIEYGIKNDIYINVDIINRIFHNLSNSPKYFNDLIDILIENKKNLFNIIELDKEKDKHLEIYIEYIYESLDTFYAYNHAKNMIFELDKEKVLEKEMCTNIINKYIKITNNLCNKLKRKQESFIRGLTEINSLKKELNYILKKITRLSQIQKDKIRECLVQLLRLKRYIISDEVYVGKDMHDFTYKMPMEDKEISKARQELLKNAFSLYANSKIDFVEGIGKSLEFYSEFPMQSLFSSYHIDTERQIYFIDTEKTYSDNFKKYFDEKGKEYTEQHPQLTNKLGKDYYEELLKYTSKTFNVHQQLILLVLKEEGFREIINELKRRIGYNYNNDYAIIVNNILFIEKIIRDVLIQNKLEDSEKGFDNINRLFEYFKEDDRIVNGLMYLNYILYEKSGMNLRNDIMHGTLVNTNLSIPLLVSFAGLIFANWLINAK